MTTSPPPLPPEREQGGAILPPETLAEYQRLADAASKGPWHVTYSRETVFADDGCRSVRRNTGYVVGPITMGNGGQGFMTPETADFVAASRTIVPALLAHATALARQLQEAEADLEICMAVLDKLAYPTTIADAILSNLGPAAVNEIEARAELADRERKRTAAWKRAEQDADRLEAEGSAPAAGEGVGRGE